MNCTRAREIFPELLDERAATPAAAEARAHLADCPDCQREFASLSQTLSALDAMPVQKPTPRLRANFYAMLEEEKHSAASVQATALRERRAQRASFWRIVLSPIAACALLAAGFYVGTRYAPSAAPADPASKTEVANLQKQVTKMSQLLADSLLQQQQRPANERLNKVLAASTEQPSDKVLNDLIGTLALDPSVNVRLRALEALYPHGDEKAVREGVLTALTREESPLVQVQMIDFLVATRDREAAPALERLTLAASTDTNVREAAKRALAQL